MPMAADRRAINALIPNEATPTAWQSAGTGPVTLRVGTPPTEVATASVAHAFGVLDASHVHASVVAKSGTQSLSL